MHVLMGRCGVGFVADVIDQTMAIAIWWNKF